MTSDGASSHRSIRVRQSGVGAVEARVRRMAEESGGGPCGPLPHRRHRVRGRQAPYGSAGFKPRQGYRRLAGGGNPRTGDPMNRHAPWKGAGGWAFAIGCEWGGGVPPPFQGGGVACRVRLPGAAPAGRACPRLPSAVPPGHRQVQDSTVHSGNRGGLPGFEGGQESPA